MASETSIIKEGKVVVFPGSPQEVTFDPAEIKSQAVRDAMLLVAMQRTFREATAGKTETEEERNKAKVRCMTRFAGWKNGELEAPRGEALKLTEAEAANAIWSFILSRKRMAGDKRSETELRAAWNKLDEAKRNAILEKNKKPIAKALRQALQAKKKPTESDF